MNLPSRLETTIYKDYLPTVIEALRVLADTLTDLPEGRAETVVEFLGVTYRVCGCFNERLGELGKLIFSYTLPHTNGYVHRHGWLPPDEYTDWVRLSFEAFVLHQLRIPDAGFVPLACEKER